ncbi:MAG: hypothetical protein RBU36_05375 [Thermoanaerobaculia bacterium]|jgi:hypothetical protein|nr:hypothetical protein [Thermoanaerobaculia bacterium]
MKRIASLALASLLATALPAAAVRPADDALALVPADAVTAGMLRVSDLRTSPLAARFFDEMDRATVDGDAARFLSDARLHPVDDVDLVVFAATNGENGKALVAFEGRFEPRRLAAAAAARGAEARTAAGATYFLLKDDRQTGKRSGGAVAFVSDRLLVAGSEEGVAAALAARAAGGTGFDRGAGLGALRDRVDGNASGWLLVDRTKLPEAKGSVTISGNDGAVRNVIGAMNLVSAFTFELMVKGDSVRLSGAGYSDDTETRELLEDALRGVLAAVRIGAQEKPDVVSAIRKFKVASDRNAVTISGTLDGATIQALAAAKAEREKARAKGAHATTK